jgi:cytochrome c biogenesis protein CcmG, thiol:disulfide interchange protein DsbE
MNTKRIITVAAAVAIVAVVVFAFARGGDEGQSGAADGEVRTLSGETLGGERFDLGASSGSATVLNFFASWCPPCNQEAPELVAFAQAHSDVAVVGIATNDRRDDAVDFVEKYGIQFPVVFDGDGSLGGKWDVEYLPTTLFLDADGREVERIVGGATRAQFEEKLEAAL